MTRPLTAPGRLLCGRYRLHQQIGGGGMGAVWLARDELLGRQVAVKQVLPPSGADRTTIDQQRQRALREGRIAARLSHPHAISVYDVALENGQPWLVMEYLPSRSLAAVLAEDGVLRVDQVAQIGAQVADALAATHTAGIVHRDVKPANILIGRGDRVEGLVKITDFGISHASGDVTLTQTGQITGTPAFLAPEVAQGHEMTAASDVFSLGATLYTCLEGTPPFGMDENALGMLHKVASGIIRAPTRAGSLKKPLLKMLAADPAMRPSMPEVRDELAKVAAGRDGDTTTVLMGRTDLRPSAPGRSRTTEFTGNSVAGPAAEPAAEPTAEPTETPKPDPGEPAAARPDHTVTTPRPEEQGHSEDQQESGGRSRLLWIAAAVVAAVLVGLIVFWATALDDSGDGGGGGTAAATASQPSSARQETSGAPAQTAQQTAEQTREQTAEQPAGQSTEQQPTEQQPDAGSLDPANVRAEDIRAFLGQYHDLVVRDPAQAWALTGPTLRSVISKDNYIAFWNQFDEVQISDLQAQDGSLTATGTLVYRYRSGETEREANHVFTLIVQDGRLVLDSDRRG